MTKVEVQSENAESGREKINRDKNFPEHCGPKVVIKERSP
jgi:hypothetical protein